MVEQNSSSVETTMSANTPYGRAAAHVLEIIGCSHSTFDGDVEARVVRGDEHLLRANRADTQSQLPVELLSRHV